LTDEQIYRQHICNHILFFTTRTHAVHALQEHYAQKPKGRLIERSEYAPYIEINRLNIEANPALYKKRQSIAEHP
jgi:hypothetical protein